MEMDFREDFDSSVKVLLDGFQCLLSAYQELAEKHYVLRRSLSATTQKLKSLDPPSPAASTEQPPTTLPEPAPNRKPHEWLEENGNQDTASRDSIRAIKKAELISSKLQSLLHRALITKSYRSDVMEQDFTIPGKQGKLGCPYSPAQSRKAVLPTGSPNAKLVPPAPYSSASHLAPPNGEIKRQSYDDPIQGENCGYEASNVTPAAVGAACPIRFLDQHSPEEVAQYFEKHKHEVPRSHEVCIKRFQDNAQSIRQLDAKYGNLVAMLQGLGLKHQPMLPEQADGAADDDLRSSNKKIENWARSVHATSSNAAPQTTTDHAAHEIPSSPTPADDNDIETSNNKDMDERHSRFDRPLKEIRVGESPSRPWGISIPPQYLDRDARSDGSVPRAPIQPVAPVATAPAPAPARCPFHALQQPTPSSKPATQPPPAAAAAAAGISAPTPAPAPAPSPNAAAAAASFQNPTPSAPQASSPVSPTAAAAPPPAAPAPLQALPTSSGLVLTNHGVAVLTTTTRTRRGKGEDEGEGEGAELAPVQVVNYGTVFVDAPMDEVIRGMKEFAAL